MKTYNNSNEYLNEVFFGNKSSYQNDWRHTVKKFAFEMKPGDILLFLDWPKNAIKMIGRVGKYHFDEFNTHFRPVNWTKMDPLLKIRDEDLIRSIRKNQANAIHNIDHVKEKLIHLLNERHILIDTLEIPSNYERKSWIFQANPKKFDLLAEMEKSNKEIWAVNQYKTEIKTGDTVYFWIAGKNRGIYAVGSVTSNPYEIEEPNEFGDTKVNIIIKGIIEPYLNYDEIMEHTNLQSLTVITSRSGTNFKVKTEQKSQIEKLLDGRIHLIEDEAEMDSHEELDDSILEEFEKILNDKPQIILYGPPGTGKTYIARQMAQSLSGSEINWQMIQFHPSYSYEDFVEGITIETNESGQIIYNPTPKIFRTLCEKALETPEEKFFLIIDEINRGDISSIFGELIFALEYRGSKVTTTYLKSELIIPKNLFIVGTMNSTDHSIKLIDHALRRRFHFYALHPDSESLNKWLSNNGLESDFSQKLVDLFHRINEFLWNETQDPEKKIGHTYFFVVDIEQLRIAWKYSILPLIDIYLNFKGDYIEELESIWGEIVLRSIPFVLTSSNSLFFLVHSCSF